MSIPYFYEPSIVAGQTNFTLNEISSKHCVQVLRMQENQRVDITNGMGYLFEATILSVHKKNTLVQIQSEKFIAAPSQKNYFRYWTSKKSYQIRMAIRKSNGDGRLRNHAAFMRAYFI